MFMVGSQVNQSLVNNGKKKWRGSMPNIIWTVFQNLNLIQNQMKGKSRSMNMVMRHSFTEKNYAIPENL